MYTQTDKIAKMMLLFRASDTDVKKVFYAKAVKELEEHGLTATVSIENRSKYTPQVLKELKKEIYEGGFVCTIIDDNRLFIY